MKSMSFMEQSLNGFMLLHVLRCNIFSMYHLVSVVPVPYNSQHILAFCLFFPLQILKDFLLWVKHDLGPWGPLAL